MTDIKAFNPNKQTGYHGSPYDFVKFKNEAIGTGEGAQAHGLGHYAAKSKDIADRYREDLTNIKNDVWNINEINYKGNKYTSNDDTRKFLYLKDIAYGKYNKKDQLKMLENRRKDYLQMNSPESVIKQIDDEINFVKNIDAKEFDNINNGQLYKLSIPKDDVMLREGADSYTRQPKVQKALNQLFEDTGLYKEWDKANGFNRRKKFATDETILYDIQRDLGKTPQEANDLLNSYGIKGISYNGGIDGEARVIFNPDDIDIVRKYYNQPELWQTLKGLKPNEGAELMAIENVLRSPQFPMNETDFKNYENLGLNYYQHIFQPNTVEIPGYGTVTFGRKNRGKDDITNFRMYPDLFELLQGSKKVNRTNYKNEIDREYDYLENPNNKLYQFLIEDIAEKGKRYKMMQNKETGK